MQRHLLLASLLSIAAAAPALAGVDKFNRASLGDGWVVTSGTLSISNDQLVGSDFGFGYYKKADERAKGGAVIQLNGTGLQYGAVAVGDIANGNNAYIKIQQQNASGMFEYGAFYVGNGNSLMFFELDAPVPSPATIQISFTGTVARLKIKSSAPSQVYEFDYGTTFGTGVGAGTYGPISLDNFKSKPAEADDFGPAPRRVTFSDALDLTQ